jgi:peptidoglycan lytic transglycosylase
MFLAGCGERRQPQTKNVPPPPPIQATPTPIPRPTPVPGHSATNPPSSAPPARAETQLAFPKDAKILYSEVGWASWYGPGFQNRHAANGEAFDTNQMTAAHRTLPLNSIVRVTDLKTGDSVLLRITDRGPFVNDRVIDLSRAAARQLSVYQHGTALVRIEVLQAPSPIQSGGRWCVQIGAFTDTQVAAELKDKLARRYHTAKVLQFASPTGESWLRIRVAEDDKDRAQALMRETHTDAGKYLVRLD